MSPRSRAVRAVTGVPLWFVREVRLWAAAIAGTRAVRRRRRVSEAETVLLVPISPHVGRPGARHAAPQSESSLKALQRRAMTSFGVLVAAAVVGVLAGVLVIGDGGLVGPQVVPADNDASAPTSPLPGTSPTDEVGPRDLAPADRAERRGDPTAGPADGAAVAEAGPAGSTGSTAQPGTSPTVPTTTSPTTRPSPRPSATPTPTPTPTDSPSTDPSPTPSDSPSVTGPPGGGSTTEQTNAPAPSLPV